MIGTRLAGSWTATSKGDLSDGFVCGYCDHHTAPPTAMRYNNNTRLAFCTYCNQPSYQHGALQIPAVRPGDPISGLPEIVGDLYEQARSAFSVGAYTCVVMACRKLLMNVASTKGAEEGESFKHYVEYLASNNWVPPNSKAWVEKIKTLGNTANHEIRPTTQPEADSALKFTAKLLGYAHGFEEEDPGSKPFTGPAGSGSPRRSNQ